MRLSGLTVLKINSISYLAHMFLVVLLILPRVQLRLYKENVNEDFGFSMSDGQIESGIYVHTVKSGSPASRAGLLPYDRVLQVKCLGYFRKLKVAVAIRL